MSEGSEKTGGAVDDDRAATRVTGIVIAALALMILAFGSLVRPGRMASFFQATSPGLIPAGVLVALAICGLLLAARPDGGAKGRLSLAEVGRNLAALLYLFAYTWLLPILGWLVASLGLLLSLPVLAGYRNPVGIAALTILVLGSIWLVFVVGIGAPLP